MKRRGGSSASYQATEKLGFHGRLEFLKDSAGFFQDGLGNPTVPQRAMDLTRTIQYDLGKNVLSRLELRWDHSLTGAGVWGGTVPSTSFGTPTGTQKNEWLLAANVIYKF